jgi:hypothetical protein
MKKKKTVNWFRDKMTEGLAAEVGQRGRLRLGRLVSNPYNRAYAIFADRIEGADQSGSAFVFTGWLRAPKGGLAKFITLGVREDGATIDGCTRLITQSWTTNLWFTQGMKAKYVFPWPLSVNNV